MLSNCSHCMYKLLQHAEVCHACAALQVGEGRLGVGDLRIEKTNEKAAKSVVFSVTVKGLYVKGNAACNLWSKRKQLKDAAAVVAVPIQRLVCSTY